MSLSRFRATLLLPMLFACEGGGVTWYFESAAGLDEPALVEAVILAGDCNGEVVHAQVIRPGRDAMRPPPLSPGAYGFRVRYGDADCRWVASGCTATSVARGTEVTVPVEPDGPTPACRPGESCSDGACEPERTDGGPRDGGGDGGMDGGPADDGGPHDGGTPTCDCEQPTDVCERGVCVPLVGAIDLSLARGFGCAVAEVRGTESRRVFCWGANGIGQLGVGSCLGGTAGSAAPQQVSGLPDERWVAVEAKGSHACAVSEEGSLFCWGANTQGQVGVEPNPAACSGNVPTPVRVLPPTGERWRDVGVADQNTCAITASGQRCCWGRSNQNRLGDPTAPSGAGVFLFEPRCPDDGGGWSSITGGNGGFYGFRGDSLPEAYFFGWNEAGQLAGGPRDTSTPQARGLGFEQLGLGHGLGCAIETGGRLTCWGCTTARAPGFAYPGCQQGGLGLGLSRTDLSPEFTGAAFDSAVLGIGPARSVGAWDRACAVSAEGALYCWGPDDGGALGVGTLVEGELPAGCAVGDVEGSPLYCAEAQPVQSAARDWRVVAVGSEQACAIRAGGRLYCWGRENGGAMVREPTRLRL